MCVWSGISRYLMLNEDESEDEDLGGMGGCWMLDVGYWIYCIGYIVCCIVYIV